MLKDWLKIVYKEEAEAEHNWIEGELYHVGVKSNKTLPEGIQRAWGRMVRKLEGDSQNKDKIQISQGMARLRFILWIKIPLH